MTFQTKPVLIAFLLVVTLPLAGCSALTDGDTDPERDKPDIDGEQLRTDSLAAMERVETASIDTELRVEMASQELSVEGDGVMDLSDRKMRLTTTTSIGATSIEQTQYLINDTSYMQSDALDGWVRQDLSAFDAWGTNQFSQQEQLLEDAKLEVTDETTTDGHEVYVTELSVDGDTLDQLIAQQSEKLSQLQPGVSFENATVTQHIDVETDRVRYTKLSYTLTADGQEMSMVIEQRFSDFNQPVEIELPAEAESAAPTGEQYRR